VFSKYVADELKFYVYRLIDPRNGETFYIGKGTGNRIFAHVKGELGADDDALTEKLLRIRQIRLDGFEVAHVIHRHGMSEDQAFEVEAALIDAYPEVTNQVAGRASDERGLMHANQVIERYEALPALGPLLLRPYRESWLAGFGSLQFRGLLLRLNEVLVFAIHRSPSTLNRGCEPSREPSWRELPERCREW
jgi:hypothetical protein